MNRWEWLLGKAREQIKAADIPDFSWSFGGGTSLMIKFDHRESKDIDIFVNDIQMLSYLSPRVNDAVENEIGRYDEQSNFIRLYFENIGEIDFIHAKQITEFVPKKENVGGKLLYVENPVETIAKKIYYRSEQFKPRDVFDLAVVYSNKKTDFEKCATFLSKFFEPIVVRINQLEETGSLEEGLSQLEIRNGGEIFRGSEFRLSEDFFNTLRRSIDKAAMKNEELRSILQINSDDYHIAKFVGAMHDSNYKSWYVHKDRLFEMPRKWGGKIDDSIFFGKATQRMKNEQCLGR